MSAIINTIYVFSLSGFIHNPLFIKTFYLCEITDEQLLWRNYNRVFDKLYVFYCVVSGNLLHTFTFGVVKSVVVLLFVDTAIFIGLLVVGLVKMDLRGKEVL